MDPVINFMSQLLCCLPYRKYPEMMLIKMENGVALNG